MVGDSNGHGEVPPSTGIGGRDPRKRVAGDLRDTVKMAAERGRLNTAQEQALADLLSRMGLLDFESRRIISVMVSNIALEDSEAKRCELALQLEEYLEGDGLAKDLAPRLSGAFKPS